MKNWIFFLSSFLLIITINSCHTSKMTGTKSSANKNLYQYKWYLSVLDGKPYTFDGSNNDYTWLLFNEGNPAKVSGFTGCNRLMGPVELKGEDYMKFSPIATTKMACPGNIESTFLHALASVDNYRIANNQLFLNSGNVEVAKLNGVSMEMDKLSGKWELDYISGPKISFEGLYPDKKPFISFNFSSNKLMGNTTCNGFSAKFSINGNKIHFTDPLKTMIFCEGGGEETFLNMLKKVNKYSVSDSVLTFLIDDVAVMRFVKK